MPRLLFLCSQNKLRSPTAEQVFSQYPGIECDSAGLHESANVYLSPEQLRWADIIFVMDKAHRNKLQTKFRQHLNGKRVIVLGIPDDYAYMDPVLVTLLRSKVSAFVRFADRINPANPASGDAA